MRYAIFTDIHANLEALEAVLAKIDELAKEDPIDEIWFLGDLVGYGPNPNECITKLRERTQVIIAGNHDWAAIGKIDLEDFSDAARVSAEWTATQLTDEHKEFLTNLPERIEKGECILVHGSPYGPLWEYLTSEVLAERSFQQFNSRYCFVGHTHVPIIFQQPDLVANSPTRPLDLSEMQSSLDAQDGKEADTPVNIEEEIRKGWEETEKIPVQHAAIAHEHADKTYNEQPLLQDVAEKADTIADLQHQLADDQPDNIVQPPDELTEALSPNEASSNDSATDQTMPVEIDTTDTPDNAEEEEEEDEEEEILYSEDGEDEEEATLPEEITPEEAIQGAEERLNQEIEELLELLGLSQSMIEITNEMVMAPEGDWHPPEGYRAIVNPGGVGQPRDGDPRAAFMIYDTHKGFTFYRVEYDIEKTQEKIIKAKLPPYLATRLAYGR